MIRAAWGTSNNPPADANRPNQDAVEALKILVQAGIEIHRRAANGQTTHHRAQGPNATLRFLTENDVDPDNNGKTPVD
jgi:hypothetical protein